MTDLSACRILDGKVVASSVRDEVSAAVRALREEGRRAPGLAVVLVGEDPASKIYVKNKVQSCKKTGIESFLTEFGANDREQDVIARLAELNRDPLVDGILVQLPLPRGMSAERVLDAIDPDKDADGLHPLNLGRLAAGRPGLRPCTPLGVIRLLDHYGIDVSGKRAVVIGRSNLVGKPLALMLLERNATVTVCHSKTRELPDVVRQADILVAAAGLPEFVRGSWLKPGCVVVDVGIHRREVDGGAEIVGDVHFGEAQSVASYLTPVPGGVGPMTVAMLMFNTLTAYKRRP